MVGGDLFTASHPVQFTYCRVVVVDSIFLSSAIICQFGLLVRRRRGSCLMCFCVIIYKLSPVGRSGVRSPAELNARVPFPCFLCFECFCTVASDVLF